MSIKKLLCLLTFSGFFAACTVQQPTKEDSLFNQYQPRSILIVPIVNHSVDVYAPTSMLTTLPQVLGEKGYYVFPVNTVKTILDHEGLYEPAEIRNVPTPELAGMFGADSILYVTINKWTSQYVLLSTTTVVNFDYEIVDKDGRQLWKANKQLTYTPDNGNSSGNPLADLIASAITAAIERAAPNYIPLARQANHQVFYTGSTALPPGPYAPEPK